MRDVVEERPVRPDDEHPLATEPAAVLEHEVRSPVQSDCGLARARSALDDEHLVHRRTDHDVLLGLDRGDDLAHRAGAGSADLGEHRIGDPAGDVASVGIVEVFIEVGGDLGAPPVLSGLEREAATQGDAERVGAGRPIERCGDRRPPVDHDRVVLVVFDVAPPDVPDLLALLAAPRAGLNRMAPCRCGRRSRQRPGCLGRAGHPRPSSRCTRR